MKKWQCVLWGKSMMTGSGVGRAVRNLGFCLVCAVTIIGSFCPSAVAASYVITDTLDSTNVTSLRGAIVAANSAGGVNTIFLTGSSYALTISGPDEPGACTGDLNVTNGSLIIEGAAPSTTIIDAAGLHDRVFQVSSNAQLILLHLTIQGAPRRQIIPPTMLMESQAEPFTIRDY